MPNKHIGKKGLITVTFRNGDQLQIEVIIHDERQIFGRAEYLITPVAGSGEAWKSNVKLT